MNKFYTVFLTALLAAGITMATDSVAELLTVETLRNPEFLTKQDPFADQVKKKVLREDVFTGQILSILEPRKGIAENAESKSKAMEILKETEVIVKNTTGKIVDYLYQASEDAVEQAKNKLPGAMGKAKEMGESMAKTFMEYMKKTMSLITNSFKKMMGKDDHKAQNTHTNDDDDELNRAVKMVYESGRYQEIKYPNQKKENYKAILQTLSQNG
jgi:hypothetical protein